MEHAESDRKFALQFRQVFGITPNVLLYELEELRTRLTSAEKLLQQLATGSLSTAMKLEATTLLLDSKHIVDQEELYREIDTYKENLKIEGLI